MDIDMNQTGTLENLLQIYPSIQKVLDKDRVKCQWTQHEMPARFDIVLKYIQGKKYQQILKKMNKNDTIEEYRKFLETSTKKNHEHQFFCKLTGRHINKEPHHIKKHVEGKKFKRAFLNWQQCQANGTEYVLPGRNKKKAKKNTDTANDDDEYVDLSDDEIVVEDEDDDLSDLYPDFRRLRASDGKPLENKNNDEQEASASGTKRKAQVSQIKKPKKLAAPSSKRMRSSYETPVNGDSCVQPMKTMTMTI